MLITAMSFSQEQNETKKDTTNQKVNKLDEVIVTGKLNTDPVLTIVSNNYEKDIVQPKNVADLFNNINGFSVIKRGNYAIDPSFRASQYEQLNIQYDGGTKAMHACPNRMDPITTHIIPEEISKIEIIKGPYTVRYGATFGGVVNLVTQKPDYEDYGIHGKVSGGYESNGSSLVNLAQLQYIQEKYDIVANAGYRDFGNYEDGNGIEIPSSFRSTDYGIKLGYNFTEDQRLQAHWRQSFGRDVLHAALPMDTEFDNSSILSLDYKLDNIGNVLKSLTAKGYYSYVDHLMTNNNRPSFMMMEASSAVDATTIGGKLETDGIKVVVNDIEVGTVSSKTFNVPAKKEFSIPLNANIPANKILNLNNLSGLLNSVLNKGMQVQYKGEIKYKVFGFSHKYTLDEIQDVKIKL